MPNLEAENPLLWMLELCCLVLGRSCDSDDAPELPLDSMVGGGEKMASPATTGEGGRAMVNSGLPGLG